MKVLTEAYLRAAFRKEPFTTLEVAGGQILTPSATQFLGEKRVQIVRERGVSAEGFADVAELGRKLKEKGGFVSELDGSHLSEKPEHMTHLRGNRLVPKSHPRILLRGRLDSFQAELLPIQAAALEMQKKALADDLGTVLRRVQLVLKAEVTESPLEQAEVIGLSRAELREQSHHPQRFYSCGHLMPDCTMGTMVLAVNRLRAGIREVELAAADAFCNGEQLQRGDLVEALNALSSALYLIMIREHSGWYGGEN